jgi:hypothetical protein
VFENKEEKVTRGRRYSPLNKRLHNSNASPHDDGMEWYSESVGVIKFIKKF